jgi:hypothetical protein
MRNPSRILQSFNNKKRVTASIMKAGPLAPIEATKKNYAQGPCLAIIDSFDFFKADTTHQTSTLRSDVTDSATSRRLQGCFPSHE